MTDQAAASGRTSVRLRRLFNANCIRPWPKHVGPELGNHPLTAVIALLILPRIILMSVTIVMALVAGFVCLMPLKVPAPTSGKRPLNRIWNKQNLGKWLANERLIGVLVDRGQYEACHQALGTRSSPKQREGEKLNRGAKTERVWRLAGLARCAHCGSMLAGSTSYGRSGEPRYYLLCIRRLKAQG